MKPKAKRTTQLTIYLALCAMLLSSDFGMHAQGMSRAPAGRYENALPVGSSLGPLDSLARIQSRPAIAPRTTPQGETISIHDLLIPAGAVKEFQRSEKAVRSGDFRSAAHHLQKALQIDPSFVQAHNNLGASYIHLNQYESAVTEFRKAIELNTKMEEPYRNLGLGLFLLRRYPEAELAARQAVQLNPQRTAARYTLGRILAAEGSYSAEAEQLLRQSVADFPDARLALTQVLLNRGAFDQAATELRIYLKSPGSNPAAMQSVQWWLNRITQAQVRTSGAETKPGSSATLEARH
jgi:Flp pilus assembly protein TadD